MCNPCCCVIPRRHNAFKLLRELHENTGHIWNLIASRVPDHHTMMVASGISAASNFVRIADHTNFGYTYFDVWLWTAVRTTTILLPFKFVRFRFSLTQVCRSPKHWFLRKVGGCRFVGEAFRVVTSIASVHVPSLLAGPPRRSPSLFGGRALAW